MIARSYFSVILGFAFAISAVCSASESGAQLSPMIALFHKWQMETAPAVVDKAAAQGHDHVQFCIALQATLGVENRVSAIGLYREAKPPGSGNAFHASNSAIRSELKGYLKACFKRAVDRKLAISVLLHLNSHGEVTEWRNYFDFDPLAKISGFSYEESYVNPVMEALEETLPADWPLEVSLQGEMGTTVFKYPKSWGTLLKRVRDRGTLSHVKFGLSFNYQGVAGGAPAAQLDVEALKQLWDSCDFIGISMYQAVSCPPRHEDFDMALGLFAGEFYALKCSLPTNKRVHFVEVGIGGGGLSSSDWKSYIPALHPEDAARSPYLGSADPAKADPWKSPELRLLRTRYHQALCDFLSEGRSRYPVKRAFLWSFGSWDPEGLEEDHFGDAEIMRRIREHNQKIKSAHP